MHNSISNTWVQLVNKLFMQRGQTGGHLSPVSHTYYSYSPTRVGSSVVIPGFVQWFYDCLSTPKINHLHLLNPRYTPNPQSLLLQPLRKNLKG